MRGSIGRLASQGRQIIADNCTASCSSRTYSTAPVTATLFPGDGIGPEIAQSVRQIFSSLDVPIEWDEQHIGKKADPRTNSMVTRENLDSVLVCSPSFLDLSSQVSSNDNFDQKARLPEQLPYCILPLGLEALDRLA